jgi:pimeloyl-ACP methyl ester carboxylesterase
MTAFTPHPVATGSVPVRLLHGVFTDHHLWDRVVTRVPDLAAVALDMPGHGSAPRLHPLPDLDGLVELLAAELAGGPPAVLAGHSWGGMLALRLAVRHPDRVLGLLLCNTPLEPAPRAGFRAQRALLAAGLPPGTYGRIAAGTLYGPGHLAAHPEVRSSTAATVARLGRRGARDVLRRVLLEPGDAVPLLRRVAVPVVLLAGTEDYVASTALRARVADTGHELALVPGGHTSPAEAPAEVAAALAEVVARRAGATLPR